MHDIKRTASRVTSLLAVLVLAVGLAAAGSGLASATSGGGCNPYVDGTLIPVPCSFGSGSGGSSGAGGSGGTTVNNACTTTPLDQAQAQNLGLAWPPPKGQSWALLTCLGGATSTGPQAVLVSNATGAPAVTPQQLLVTALGELQVPYIGPGTAPPRGTDGLVGLPEWFWIPAASWHARTVTVAAGPVWASVTATPVRLTFEPGAGISPVSCAGPGTA